MAFPKKLLNSYEQVAVDLHPHWWFFWKPVASLVGSIMLAIVVITKVGSGTPHDILAIITLGLIVIAALWLVKRYLEWTTTFFVVTTDRLIYRHGIFSKAGVEIPLERVMNVNFNQTFFERILGAGDLLIESGGKDGQQTFTDIRKPEMVQNLIHSEMEGNETRKFSNAGSGVVAAPDVATQLEKLEGLLQRNTITQVEFDAQKAKLLSR